MNANEFRELNSQRIFERLDEGLALLREHYSVEERTIDPLFTHVNIAGRPHHARRFDIEGVGNLQVMTVTQADENQLSTFVITPYFKNLPLFSTDYVYNAHKRFFLIELYDLSIAHDSVYDEGIRAFAARADTWSDMPDFPTRPCWYDEIRPVCIAKTPSMEQDELSLQRFLEMLRLFIRMEQTTPALDDDGRMKKWRLNKGYADRLIDEGGVSTELWTAAFGAENTRRFFDEVFFGAACYKPKDL